MVTDPPAGISFMGKVWDQDHGGRGMWVRAFADIFSECRRVLKPGAHALVWALPRTSHWTATALEDARFEIRDVVTHLFGQGFPKSLDVSKALDHAAGVERPILRTEQRQPKFLHAGDGRLQEQWRDETSIDITAPATDLARQWDGWGTALKPASEHWILCRAPLSESTVAANVARWGTGALNIDGGRLDGSTTGRWPPNVALSHSHSCTNTCDSACPIALLGGVSRFFYGAKANPSERLRGFPPGERNAHPTVKPVDLMRWLLTLVVPPGGTVLDPFMGSGSTLVAASGLGIRAIGIDQDPNSCQWAKWRLDGVADETA